MKCVIPDINLKVFGRAIHSLSKIGEELYIEPLAEGLALRTVNSSRSAYACFQFSPTFFQHYDDGGNLSNGDETDEDGFKCKLAMKSILSVFRSMYTIEKTVEKCKIQLHSEESRLVFQLYCKHGIIKTHNLAFIECETLQAVFGRDMSPNVLKAPAKLLCDVVVNFQSNQEEITLTVCPNKVSLKNYTEDELDPAKIVHTELTLTPAEFDDFQVGVDAEITFCLKELRAILAFVEVTNLPLGLHFETPGRPVIFTVDSDHTFEASFVLATLAESEPGASQQPTQSRGKKQTQTKHNSSKRPYTSYSQSSRSNTTNKSRHEKPSTSGMTNGLANRSHKADSSGAPDEEEVTMGEHVSINEATTFHHMDTTDTDLPTEQGDALPTIFSPKPRRGLEDEEPQAMSEKPLASAGSGPSPVIPIQTDITEETSTSKPRELVLQDLDEDEEDDDEMVPGTPPSKKFRRLLFGSSQSQPTQSQAPPPGNILAEDTDEDD